MALNSARVNEVADATQLITERLLDAIEKMEAFLKHQSDQAIAWTADPRPAYISVDPGGSGNLEGRNYSPAKVANAIGSLDFLRRVLNNEPITITVNGEAATGTAGDHLGNLNLVARPVGKR